MSHSSKTPSLRPPRSKRAKLLLTSLKVLLAVAILGFLMARIQSQSGFERLWNGPKNWPLLLLAQALILMAFSLSFVRWYLLARGLGLQFHLRDAFRLGSLGYMLNQVSPGSVGGDLLKAVFIAKEQPGRKTEAVATVFIDRVVGLYAILLVASVGLALLGQSAETTTAILSMQKIVWTTAAVGTVGLLLAMSPLASLSKVHELAERVPVVGPTLVRLLDAVAVYRSRRRYLVGALGLALITHNLVLLAFWIICRSLPVYAPTLYENASIVPLGLVISTIPLTPGGLGTLEAGFEFLYTTIGAAEGDGTIVALTYRAMTYGLAAIGACYYFTAKKKVNRLLHEAEALAKEIG